MRTLPLPSLSLLVAATLLLPVIATAQQPTPGQPGPSQGMGTQRVGRMQRQNCAGADTSFGVRRGIGGAGATAGAGAQPSTGMASGANRITGGTTRSQEYPEFDVVLDIPNLCVQKIYLKVDSVTARLALKAQVANLLRVNAGADVLIGNVDLTIQGVRAQALLLVDLDDVVQAVDQTLTFVDNHPEVVNQLTGTLQNTGAAVGGLVNNILNGLLLGTTRNSLGQTVQRYVDQTTGSIIERTLSSAGQSLADRAMGSITSLPQVSQTRDAAGRLVRRVRDQTGMVIEYVQDAAGRLSSIRIVQ
ncbi:MAG: hypothetical protein HOQ09_10755 [Gemmatimonadaceae bacterium]|nr:hypothetical protein [Gemmatimonadaceae bacterium]